MYKSLLCILDTYSADLVQLFAYYASVGKADIMAPDSMTLQQARAADAHSRHTRTHTHTHTRAHARTHTPGSIVGPPGPAGGRSNAKARDESPRCTVRSRLRPVLRPPPRACVTRPVWRVAVVRCALQVRRAVRRRAALMPASDRASAQVHRLLRDAKLTPPALADASAGGSPPPLLTWREARPLCSLTRPCFASKPPCFALKPPWFALLSKPPRFAFQVDEIFRRVVLEMVEQTLAEEQARGMCTAERIDQAAPARHG
jgi:hypothetical protein